MTVNGDKQNITSIPFGSEKGMTIRKFDEDSQTNIDKVIAINEAITWLTNGKRIDGYVYDENHIHHDNNGEIELIEIPYGSLIEDRTKFQGVLVDSENKFDIKYSAFDIQMYHENIYMSAFVPEKDFMPKIRLLGGMNIEIGACKGFIDGIGFQMLRKQTITIEKGSDMQRMDSIILRKEQGNKTIYVTVLRGEEGLVLRQPQIITDTYGTYELLICNVIVRAYARDLVQNDIEDKRIVLRNPYAADYVVRNDWDLQKLCQTDTGSKRILIMTDVRSHAYTIPSSVTEIKSLSDKRITGSISISNATIENIIFDSGTVRLVKCLVKNSVFKSACEKLESKNVKFEKCIINSKVDFEKSVYIDDGIVGEIKNFSAPKEKIPDGWLLCDGSSVSRDLFKELFSVIGTTWGEGDGEATFNLPDGRGGVLKCIGASEDGFFKDDDAAKRTNTNDEEIGDVVGSYQKFDIGKHEHSIANLVRGVAFDRQQIWMNSGNNGRERHPVSNVWVTATSPKTASVGTGMSTRDNNIAVCFIIKAS